jgi:mono/diheme cytochrome c family protein
MSWRASADRCGKCSVDRAAGAPSATKGTEMITYRVTLILSAFLLTTLLAWSAKQPKEQSASRSELDRAPTAARQRPNPYAARPEAALAGKNLYARYCAQCHGDGARGRGKAPDLRSSIVQDAAPGTLFWFLKNGNLKEGMPSWSRLPDQQLWQLVSYLRTLSRTPLPPDVDTKVTTTVTPPCGQASVGADLK